MPSRQSVAWKQEDATEPHHSSAYVQGYIAPLYHTVYYVSPHHIQIEHFTTSSQRRELRMYSVRVFRTRSIPSRFCCIRVRRIRTATNAEPCKSYTAHNVIPLIKRFTAPSTVVSSAALYGAYCVAHCGPPSSSSSSSHSAPPARGSPDPAPKSSISASNSTSTSSTSSCF